MPSDFDTAHTVCFSQGRRGEVYVYGGHGYRGKVWSPSEDEFRPVGTDAPVVAPTVTPAADIKYYVARIDIVKNGTNYNVPPEITLSGGGGADATAVTRLREWGVAAVEMVSYGKNYTSIPDAEIDLPTGGTQATATCTVVYGTVSTWSITAGGSRYIKNPRVFFRGGGGSGATAEAVVVDGVVVDLVLISGGYDYTTSPTIYIEPPEAPPAEVFPVMRAHLRGKYQCYYRYVNDSVPASEGGPLYSNLSPVAEADCGDGSASILWNFAQHETISTELWRSTSNQATTLFRVAKYGGDDQFPLPYDDDLEGWTDALTDWELMDPTRQGFQAMPVLLPNGELNANRFGVPPDYYSSAVLFQDRMWMAVDTAGGNANTLRYSEIDEPESMPDVNELLLQTNLRATDYITALIPCGGAMLIGQSRHLYRLTYVSQPLLDASVTLLSYRGVLNQRCWDIHEGSVYAMDDQGVYSVDPGGNVESLTVTLNDIWQDRIDYSLAEWFTLRVDKKNSLLRVCVAIKGDGSAKFPSRMYVYSLAFKTWWEERYPAELTCATEVRIDSDIRLVYGTSAGALRILNSGSTDLCQYSVSAVTITSPGRGYITPPTITAPGGHGAVFECGLNTDGSITGISIKFPGTKYAAGNLVISPPPVNPPGSSPATATSTLTGSGVSAVTVTSAGSGYTAAPLVTLSGGGGAGATAVATIAGGSVTGIAVTNAGTGYASAPTVSITQPGAATATFTVTGGSQPVYWSFRSGAFEFVSDSTDKRGGEAQSRHCSVVYKPTTSECLLSLQSFYNNASYPRSNAVRRDRGTGFVHSDVYPAAILNMQATPQQNAEASGVARALFSGTVLDDITGNDRHVSIALSGKRNAAGQVVIYSLDIFGVNGQ